MRRPRLRTVAAGTAITAASLLTAGPASAAGPAYVALGDSYSSGTGTGSYDPSAGDCQRSGKAYPRLWAAEHKPAKFAFVACAGATTSTVQSAQLGALHRNTRLVSITVGGNDADFAGVMQVCVIQSAANCETAVGNAENVMKRTLPGRLDKLYAGIHRRSPSARVVVLDYPHLYTIVSGCVGIGNAKRTVLNRAADTLDETVRRAAARARFVFADVRPRFAGHELCSGQGWLNAVTIPFGSSYHPTARGHAEGYLPVFSAAVDRALENAAAR